MVARYYPTHNAESAKKKNLWGTELNVKQMPGQAATAMRAKGSPQNPANAAEFGYVTASASQFIGRQIPIQRNQPGSRHESQRC
jgi:hypothetical protein